MARFVTFEKEPEPYLFCYVHSLAPRSKGALEVIPAIGTDGTDVDSSYGAQCR